MEPRYFIVRDGRQAGPFLFGQLSAEGVAPDTLVWREGLEGWTPAGTLPELAGLFGGNVPPQSPEGEGCPPVNPAGAPGEEYPGGQKYDGYGPERNGFGNRQNPYRNQEDPYGQNPYGNQQNPYGNQQDPYGNRQNPYGNNQPPYGSPYRHVNWMPWAIVVTICGFLFSCIGGIFGIIAIVQANRANTAWSLGNYAEEEAASGTAKTMVIIGGVLAGLGILASGSLMRILPEIMGSYPGALNW